MVSATRSEFHMDEATRASMETYLHNMIHCVTIDAEILIIGKELIMPTKTHNILKLNSQKNNF